jgi:hypothetical protein
LCRRKKVDGQALFLSPTLPAACESAQNFHHTHFSPSNPILNPRSPPLPLSTTSAFPHFAPIFAYKPPSGVPTTSLLHPPQVSTAEATSSPRPIPIHSCHRSSAVFSSTLLTGSPPLAASLLVPLQQPPVRRSVPLFLKKHR